MLRPQAKWIQLEFGEREIPGIIILEGIQEVHLNMHPRLESQWVRHLGRTVLKANHTCLALPLPPNFHHWTPSTSFQLVPGLLMKLQSGCYFLTASHSIYCSIFADSPNGLYRLNSPAILSCPWIGLSDDGRSLPAPCTNWILYCK